MLALDKADRLGIAPGDAEAAPNAALRVNLCHRACDLNGRYRATLVLTYSASVTEVRINLGAPPADREGVGILELGEPAQNSTAAGAAVADEAQPILAVVGRVHQACLFRSADHVQRFLLGDFPGKPSVNEETASGIEDQAYVPRLLARFNANAAGTVGQRKCLIPVEHLRDDLEGQDFDPAIDGAFHGKYPSDGGGTAGEGVPQGFTVVIFPQLRQRPVHRLTAAFHEGELEQAGDGGQQRIAHDSILLPAEDDALVGQ